MNHRIVIWWENSFSLFILCKKIANSKTSLPIFIFNCGVFSKKLHMSKFLRSRRKVFENHCCNKRNHTFSNSIIIRDHGDMFRVLWMTIHIYHTYIETFNNMIDFRALLALAWFLWHSRLSSTLLWVFAVQALPPPTTVIAFDHHLYREWMQFAQASGLVA